MDNILPLLPFIKDCMKSYDWLEIIPSFSTALNKSKQAYTDIALEPTEGFQCTIQK